MSCGGGHLEFPIDKKKNTKLCRGLSPHHSHQISVQLVKNKNFVEIHPRNIPAKFGSKWPNGFRGED